MIAAPHGYTQTFVVRVASQQPLDRVISALADLTEQRILRIVDLRMLARDANGAVTAITVEHLWWSRMARTLADAQAELISDLETPKAIGRYGPGAEQLRQIEQLNEMRRVGTLTEGEFASAKRTLLSPQIPS